MTNAEFGTGPARRCPKGTGPPASVPRRGSLPCPGGLHGSTDTCSLEIQLPRNSETVIDPAELCAESIIVERHQHFIAFSATPSNIKNVATARATLDSSVCGSCVRPTARIACGTSGAAPASFLQVT